ncbi:MAG: AEC family transporter [Deltaproteobacteria bacterium]|nr:AEC family transporter [Deltaproteobacteria bacterium]MBM4297378.1 AEC family transporter [Deltaproteobacteria bacterium]
MDLFKPLAPVVPVFMLVAAGFIFARFKKINLAPVTEIIVYLGTPSLVFSSLASRPIFLADIAALFFGVLIIFAGVGLLIKGYFLSFRFSSRGFALPSLFMNAGNMGIPLALFAFGQAGMQRATLMFVIITFLQYTLGIYILNGRGNWQETFRLPLIYATIAGLTVNLTHLKIPELLLQPFSLLGQASIPIMLISLGYRLYDVESIKWGHALGGALVRIFGGSAAAFAAVTLIGAQGVNRQVLLLYGCLPAAVINFILTEKYRQDPDLAASIVVLSTFISVFTIPIMFWLIL